MNWEQMAGSSTQIGHRLRARWLELTDADLERIAGKRERLIDTLQVTYGLTGERAESEVRDWERHQDPIEPVRPTG